MLSGCAVIGHPVAHSLSPAIHRAAYAALGLDWQYTAIDVAPDGLAGFMAGLDEQLAGLSVTMPHKVELVNHGQPDDLVRLTGVANTWVRTDQGPIVRNTDVLGYGQAFASAGLHRARRAILVGNGATATSALVGLSRLGVTDLLILARDPGRARGLLALAVQLGVTARAQSLALGDEPLPPADLLVSTIPSAGVDPHAAALAASAALVFDSIYDPWPTALAQAAQAAGRPVLNGLDLLAGQAVEQVRLMTGGQVSFDLLRAAARDAIERPTQL